MAAGTHRAKRLPLWLAVFAILTAGSLVYAAVFSFDFVYYDDDEYVFENPQVKRGLNADTIAWAFTALVSKHWHPLTWLSHMLDVTLFGLNPAGHHGMNIGLHLITVLLLFRFLVRTTGDRWPALLTALLLAVHPLHVENVAWVADRKDLLCALFWMVTLNAYAGYAAKPGLLRYLGVLLAFCLALMSKSMAITLPLVLLVLDYWPLRRCTVAGDDWKTDSRTAGRPDCRQLLYEKIPFFAVSLAMGLFTLWVLEAQQADYKTAFPSDRHWVYGAMAYSFYLYKLIWPAKLVAPYPISSQVALFWPLLSAAATVLITAGVATRFRRRPYLAAGWMWYLVVLLPVSGFIGPIRFANRYAYLPLIGIYVMILWSAASVVRTRPHLRTPLLSIMGLIVVALALVSHGQVRHWQDTRTLFSHTLRFNPVSSIAHNNLGIFAYRQGRLPEAVAHQQKAVELTPKQPEFHYNLGVSYLHSGEYSRARLSFFQALQLRPQYADALTNLGISWLQLGNLEKAREAFKKVLVLEPDNPQAYNQLGRTHLMQRELGAAEKHFRRVLSINPGHSDALANLGSVLAANGKYGAAERHFRKAIKAAPETAAYYFGLAQVLSGLKKFEAAAALRTKGLAIEPHNGEQQYYLAVDLYFTGRYKRAAEHLAIARDSNYPGIESLFEERLAGGLYGSPVETEPSD